MAHPTSPEKGTTSPRRRAMWWRWPVAMALVAATLRLQTAVDLGRVTDELGTAIGVALRPALLAVWFAEGGPAR